MWKLFFLDDASFCGSNILVGFPARAVSEILAISNSSISEQILSSQTSILNESLYPEILKIVHGCLLSHPMENENLNERLLHSSSSSELDSSESESEYKRCAVTNSDSEDNV